MNVRLLFATMLLSGSSVLSFAQEGASSFGGIKKGPLLGFGVNLTDYTASLPEIGKINLGASVMFWNGITPNLDYSIRYNGLFSDYALPVASQEDKFISELEGSLHLRALSDNHLFNPFISAGIGGGRYSNSYVAYAPVGVGIQMNLFSDAYIFLQGNYRFTFDDTKLHNSTFYSLGFTFPLRAKKPMVPPPPPDRDGDGVPDVDDACPDIPGLPSLQGCPDRDHDGIADNVDKCPDVPGVAKYQGCPIPDTDGDGINDEEDQCPTVKGLAKYHGCPMPDKDGDGVADEDDKCPNVAGPASNQGCPVIKEEAKARLAFAAKSIQFETGKSTIKFASYKMLDDITAILNEYPDYNITVDGYTDNTGNAAKNLSLSQQRSDAVKEYFVKKGIDAGRIKATGHGIENPKADNKTAAGRAENRRVEMDLHLKD
jgi:OOP family OmpA-OmpF porin